MKMIPVSIDTINSYIEVGKNSYCQHYLHLWPANNPAPYIENNYTTEVVQQDLKDPNLLHYSISKDNEIVGILKIVVDAAVAQYSGKESMLLEKIYLLAPYSGQGLGKQCLRHANRPGCEIRKEGPLARHHEKWKGLSLLPGFWISHYW